jgi:uncharacterized lipoprotein YddW (UPF0748 family)
MISLVKTKSKCWRAWVSGLTLSLGSLLTMAAADVVIDPCSYADDAAAQRAWVPMGDSAPVSVATVEGRKVLRLSCNLAGTKIERASWDQQVKLDLSSGRGIAFKVLCRDASPISYFSIYFQSGNGWYHGSFYPESDADWNTVSINKSEMTIEGEPAGWGQINAIRISAWRGKDADTEFYLSDLRRTGVLGEGAAVAIFRAESAAQLAPAEARSVQQFTETMAETLRQLQLDWAVLSDLDATAATLKKAKVVILPHNPSLPDRTADELVRYVSGGGKLLVFYTVPEKLRAVLKFEGGAHVKAARPGNFSSIRFFPGALPGAPTVVAQQSWNICSYQAVPGASRVLAEWFDENGKSTGYPAVLSSLNSVVMSHVLLTDDAVNKRRMLLALIGLLAPEVWKQAAEGEIGRIGVMGGYTNYDAAAAQIGKAAPGIAKAKQALTAARELRDTAVKLATENQFADAMDHAGAAQQKMTEAFCLAQQPAAGEFRAFWCHSAFGVQGMDWDEAIRRLAENGFTAIIPNMLWGGVAFYPSKVLPVAPQVPERGDQVARCVAACRKYGVEIHVWKVNWNLGQAAPKEFVDRLRREGRLQADASGKEERWLCPSHPENQALEIASMVEVARDYDVDGIHFDYIRYPDGEHCFCAGCRKRFERSQGRTVANWPKAVLASGPLREAWLDWRRNNITAVVRAVSEQARALKPKIKISAAVFPNWATDRASVGQDWKLWCENGYVDFVCPMDYTPSNRNFDNLVNKQRAWAGHVPCYPGIGVSASSSHFGVDRVIEQINITRRHGTGGFTIFNYAGPESRELLPLLGLGITRSPKPELENPK